MNREKKTDILKMIYQFLAAGAIFWLAILGRETPLVGKAIYSLQDNYGLNVWGLILILFAIIGMAGIIIQRKIHIKQYGK